MFNLAVTLVKKLRKAKQSAPLMKDVYISLCETMKDEDIKKWKMDEDCALTLRGDTMKIYDLVMEQGEHISNAFEYSSMVVGPSQIKVSLALTKEEAKRKLLEGSSSVISEALKLEEQQ
jgi:hypothetical protein